MFPVDPRDFITQAFVNRVDLCSANLAATDSPQEKGYQFSWSLGTPFLKGCVIFFSGCEARKYWVMCAWERGADALIDTLTRPWA